MWSEGSWINLTAGCWQKRVLFFPSAFAGFSCSSSSLPLPSLCWADSSHQTSKLISCTDNPVHQPNTFFCQVSFLPKRFELAQQWFKKSKPGWMGWKSISPVVPGQQLGSTIFLVCTFFLKMKKTTKCKNVKSWWVHMKSTKNHSCKYCKLKYGSTVFDNLMLWIV